MLVMSLPHRSVKENAAPFVATDNISIGENLKVSSLRQNNANPDIFVVGESLKRSK